MTVGRIVASLLLLFASLSLPVAAQTDTAQVDADAPTCWHCPLRKSPGWAVVEISIINLASMGFHRYIKDRDGRYGVFSNSPKNQYGITTIST